MCSGVPSTANVSCPHRLTSLTTDQKKNKGTCWTSQVHKTPPANAGDMGSIPSPGRFHMRQNN